MAAFLEISRVIGFEDEKNDVWNHPHEAVDVRLEGILDQEASNEGGLDCKAELADESEDYD